MNKRKYKKLAKPLKSFFKKEIDGTFTKKESRPEQDCKLILETLDYPYHQEFNIKHKRYNKFYDFFVYSNDKNISFAIEVHSYFHGEKELPEYKQLMGELGKKQSKTKKTSKMYKVIKKNKRNDKVKAAILKELKIPLIVIWQYEIEHFPKRVIKRIKEEWKKQEKLNIDIYEHNSERCECK